MFSRILSRFKGVWLRLIRTIVREFALARTGEIILVLGMAESAPLLRIYLSGVAWGRSLSIESYAFNLDSDYTYSRAELSDPTF
jgi:hypothetical protein